MKYNMYKKILDSSDIPKENKLFCILDMLHDEIISLAKAKELCYEVKLFDKSPTELDFEVTNLFNDWTDIHSSNFS